MDKCCDNPHYKRAYVVLKLFKAKICINCGEVISDMPRPIEWIFEHFFSKIWFGMIKVTDENVE
jgi:hypothetical protein